MGQRKVLPPFEAGAGGDDAGVRQELMVARLTSTGIDKYSACISSWTLDLCNSSNFHRDLPRRLDTPYKTVLGVPLPCQRVLVDSCWCL